MQKSAAICLFAIAAGGLVSCSTKPRNFVAQFDAPPVERAAYETDFALCEKLVRAGYRSDFKQAAASGVVGAGAGFGTAVAVAPIGLAGGAGATAAAAAIPFVGIGVAFGMSRVIRSGREKQFKSAMSGCLAEYGYSVQGWELAKKRKTVPVAVAGEASAAEEIALQR